MKDFKERAAADQQNTEILSRELNGKDSPRLNDENDSNSLNQGADAGMFRRYSFDDNGGGYAGL